MTDLGPLIKNYLARRKAGGGAALDDLPDVGDPLVGDGGQFSPGTSWGNKAAEIAGKLAAGTAHGLITLPRRAIENSQSSLDTGTYDPSAPMEAALLTMGAGAGARGGQRPVSPALDRPLEPAYIPTHAPEPAQAAAAEASGDVGGGLAGAPGGGEGLREAQLSAERRASGRATLPGLPTKAQQIDGDLYVPGPVGDVHDVADRYMAAREMPSYHKPPEKYHEIDKEHSTAIARAFDEMEHAPNDPAVKASYEALIRESLAQYQAIKESGLKITPVNGADYPYSTNPRAVARDVADNNHMAFFKTDEGFGTGDAIHPDNPMLRSSGEKIGEHDMLNNDIFRVVHDYFGHIKNGYGFRGAGEDNAWRAHAAMYSDIARPAMTSETRGQNSWVNYGPHGETNRTASGADTIYAPQKVGLMPEWTMRDRGSPDPIIGYQGSPTKFDKHDLAYMGTGEGNQSYGKGHYLAGHEPVAEWYRHQLAARRDPLLKKYGLDSEDGSNLGNRLAGKQGNIEPVIDGLQQEIMNLKSQGESKAVKNMIARREGMVSYLRDPGRNKGHMYQVAIDHPPEKFLDWDKRINEHPPEVQEQIRRAMGLDYHGQYDPAKADRLWKQFQHSDTSDALRRGFIASDDNLVAERLRNAGIPGIRYLDQGSRSLGQGTHNYVTFDSPRMLKRYAEGGAVDDDVDWSQMNKPTGELKPATYRPTQRIGNAISDALRSAGMPSYTANDLTSRVGNVVSASPLGIAGSALDAVDAKARRDDAGTVTAMAGMIPGAKPLQGAARLVNAEGLATHSKDYMRAARAALDDIAGGPKGAGPLDLASMNEIPNVPQVAMDRYVPPRGVSPRLKEALEDKSIPRGIAKSIEAGRAGGADKWYHNEPIRRSFVDELGPEQGQKAFSTYMDMVSATSPRSEVPANIRNASYYYQHALEGKPLPEKLPYPYGHVAQNLHRQNFETLMAPRAGELSAGAPATGTGWDIYRNPKPASFSQNLQGNLEPGTIDTHAFRNISIRSGDPRFLATSVSDKLKPGQVPGPETLAGRYGEITGDRLVYRPQKLVESGKLSMDEAKKIPSFWETKPNENEYAAAEQLYRKLGAKVGLPTADAQAAAWSGAGKLTGLGSPPTHTFPELFNERVLYTAKMRGEDAKKTLRDFITGKKPLLSIAGAAAAGSTLAGQHQEQYARGGRTRYAEGGAAGDDYNTPVDDEPAYQAWKALNAPNDSGVDYDLRGAYLANMQRADNGHMGDRFKKPNHPTFSDQSQYAVGDQRDRAGFWVGDTFVPTAAMRAAGGRVGYAGGGDVFDPSRLNPENDEYDPAKLAAIKITPTEPADHGLSERQKLSPLGKALSPITSYPETYSHMRKEAEEQFSRGLGQIANPDSLTDPKAHGISDVLTGAGNVALGGLGYVSSPITAAYRSVIGQPVEDVTGIPREYPEFAAQLATPGIGLTRMPKAPGAPTAPAPRVLPPHADVPASIERGDEFGFKYSLGQATKDLERIRYEDMASRGAYGPAAQKQASQFFEDQYAAMQEGTQRVGQQFAHGEQPLGGPADAAASLNAEVADRATSAQRMRDQVVARAEAAAEARRQQVAAQQTSIDQSLTQGRPLAEPREAGEIVNQNVRQAAADNRAEFRGLYDEFGRLPGEFDASAVRGMGNRIRNELTYGDNPVIIDEGTPAASRAIQALDEMSQPRITNRASPHAEPDPNEITAVTLRGVDQMRKRLVGYYQQARGSGNASDMRATREVLNGFDNQIERAITENLFSGDPRALQVLQDARASYARYQRTFSPRGAGDDVGAAMRRIVDRNATPEETANMIIGSGKIGSAGLPVRIADRLEQVLGADSEAWQSIRQAMWQKASRVRNSAGEIDAARSARSVEDFANSTLARRMFPPKDLAAMRSSARGARDLERVIEQLPETRAAGQARTIYEQAFGGEQLSGSQRAVFRRMVDGTATPEETVQAMFSAIGSGNPGNTVRALQAVGRIVGRDSPTWSALKQGVWQKLTQNPFGKDQKGQQKMVQGINEFLNGSGRSIARELYSHEDRALMNRFGQAVRQTIIPKYARTNSDTAPALLAAAHKYGPKLGALIGMGGHGAVSYAIGKAIDKGADMIAAARQSKKMGESFGDISATTPNPIAGIRIRPPSPRALLATTPPDHNSPYAP